MNILDTLANASKVRVETAKKEVSLATLKEMIYQEDRIVHFHKRKNFAFENALKGEGIHFICEVKKASPSKGEIAKEFPYLEIAKDYEEAGACAISVLTEPQYFKGSNHYLSEISNQVEIPVLRKDFTVDEYQLYEAKIIGADAVLLICALLDTQTIKRYIAICDELGLSALVEAHTKEEVDSAVEAGARIIGVNNRNLSTFEVDLSLCTQLRQYVPTGILYVAESGIATREDVQEIARADVNGVLIGETLMRSKNKKEILAQLRGGVDDEN